MFRWLPSLPMTSSDSARMSACVSLSSFFDTTNKRKNKSQKWILFVSLFYRWECPCQSDRRASSTTTAQLHLHTPNKTALKKKRTFYEIRTSHILAWAINGMRGFCGHVALFVHLSIDQYIDELTTIKITIRLDF